MPNMTIPHDYRQGLQAALEGEMAAVQMYTYLASIAPTPEIARRIRDIKNDEASHAIIFSDLLAMPSTGSQTPLSMAQREFWPMVRDAYEDEVEAIHLYSHLSLLAPDLATAARIRDIMRDETTHAEFYATLLMARGI